MKKINILLLFSFLLPFYSYPMELELENNSEDEDISFEREIAESDEETCPQVESLATLSLRVLATIALHEYTQEVNNLSSKINREEYEAKRHLSFLNFKDNLGKNPKNKKDTNCYLGIEDIDNVYCYLLNTLDQAKIFVDELLYRLDKSPKSLDAFNLFNENLCTHAKANIINFALSRWENEHAHEISSPSICLIKYLIEHLEMESSNQDILSHLHTQLAAKLSFLNADNSLNLPGREEKASFVTNLLSIVDKKLANYINAFKKTSFTFSSEIQEKAVELLVLYKEDDTSGIQNLVSTLSNDDKVNILEFYLFEYLLNEETLSNLRSAITEKHDLNAAPNNLFVIYYLASYLYPEFTEITHIEIRPFNIPGLDMDARIPYIKIDSPTLSEINIDNAIQVFSRILKDFFDHYPNSESFLHNLFAQTIYLEEKKEYQTWSMGLQLLHVYYQWAVQKVMRHLDIHHSNQKLLQDSEDFICPLYREYLETNEMDKTQKFLIECYYQFNNTLLFSAFLSATIVTILEYKTEDHLKNLIKILANIKAYNIAAPAIWDYLINNTMDLLGEAGESIYYADGSLDYALLLLRTLLSDNEEAHKKLANFENERKSQAQNTEKQLEKETEDYNR